ncbi:hypothetical protein C1886_25440 [Pseudomonas sp. FW300-N1A1]|uniref:hypothetical protein n=1 Tax=unclassified Pseudomonas TaxID=196821 RepID=UPI000BA4A71F|nr:MULTISPECIES: hypothetical protein [unclassified Pseudomonas]POA16778.1 hypothetical protein C1886_25440 [Pseudomonas sp. FW300-N1A1]
MSLQMIWSLFTAHPAKLINVFALLVACPGGWLLHATRRREQQARASLAAQAGRADADTQVHLSSIATLRMNRVFYAFGFACLGLALLVSWISTRI